MFLTGFLSAQQSSLARSSDVSFNDQVVEIQVLVNKQNYDEVYIRSTALIGKKKEAPILYVLRASAWSSKRRMREAIKDLDHALKLNPQYKPAFITRAFCRQATGDVKGAVKDLEEALRLDPGGDQLVLVLRPLYKKLGKNELEYKKVLSGNLLFQGLEYESKSRNQAAMKAYDSYVAKNPGNSIGYLYRGNLYYYQKNYERALKDYKQSLDFYPCGGKEQFFVANACIALGKNKEALSHYEQMEKITDNMGFIFKYAKELRSLGYHQKAIKAYTKLISLGRGNADAFRGRADCYLKLKEYERALTDFNKAIQFDIDESPDTYRQRAVVYEKLGRFANAAADRKKADLLSR